MRELERQLAALCRAAATRVARLREGPDADANASDAADAADASKATDKPAAAATAAAAAPVAPTDDSHESRCEPVVEPSLADPIDVRAEAPGASSGER